MCMLVATFTALSGINKFIEGEMATTKKVGRCAIIINKVTFRTDEIKKTRQVSKSGPTFAREMLHVPLSISEAYIKRSGAKRHANA